MRLSQYYRHNHPRNAFIDIHGLQEYIRHCVARIETDGDLDLAKIVEAHLFRGRFSLASAKQANALETDRLIDQILMYGGVVTHYFPMNETVSPPSEKGIDLWLALEAFDMAVHKQFDILVLIAGDQDYVPLLRKVNSLGTRTMILAVDIEYEDNNGNYRYQKTSSRLMEEAAYTVVLTDEVDQATNDDVIDHIFAG